MATIKRDGVSVEVADSEFAVLRSAELEERSPPPLMPWQFSAVIAFLDAGSTISAALGEHTDEWERAKLTSYYANAHIYMYESDPLQRIIELADLDQEAFLTAWSRIAAE